MIARLLISSSPDILKREIIKILASHLKGGNSNHPDVLYFPSDSKLGIAEARKIKEHYALRPYSAKGRVVVLENAETLTVEAQNALLKTIEELPPDAVFILGASSDAKFLPTILSRCEVVYLNPTSHRIPTSEVGFEKDVEKLYSSTMEQRFEYIEKLKDRAEFLKTLVSYLHQDLSVNLEGCRLNFLKELLQAEEWAARNVNIRAILEYLMLVIPSRR